MEERGKRYLDSVSHYGNREKLSVREMPKSTQDGIS